MFGKWLCFKSAKRVPKVAVRLEHRLERSEQAEFSSTVAGPSASSRAVSRGYRASTIPAGMSMLGTAQRFISTSGETSAGGDCRPRGFDVKPIMSVKDIPENGILIAMDTSFNEKLQTYFSAILAITTDGKIYGAKVFARKALGVFRTRDDGRRLFCMPEKSSEAAELCVVYEAARFVNERLFTDPDLDYSGGIYFQLDNASAAEKIQNCFFERPVKDGGRYHDDPDYEAMILDTKVIMDEGLRRANSGAPYTICHVRREYNEIPDALAAYAQHPQCGMVPDFNKISVDNEDFNELEFSRHDIDGMYGYGVSGVYSVREPWMKFNGQDRRISMSIRSGSTRE